MDEFANNVGYAVIEVIGTVALFLALMYVAVRWSWVARTLKITFLGAWGLMVSVVPVWWAIHESGQSDAKAASLGAIGILVIGGVSYYYLGWRELARTVTNRD